MKYRYKWIDPLGNIYATEIEAEDAKTASFLFYEQHPLALVEEITEEE